MQPPSEMAVAMGPLQPPSEKAAAKGAHNNIDRGNMYSVTAATQQGALCGCIARAGQQGRFLAAGGPCNLEDPRTAARLTSPCQCGPAPRSCRLHPFLLSGPVRPRIRLTSLHEQLVRVEERVRSALEHELRVTLDELQAGLRPRTAACPAAASHTPRPSAEQQSVTWRD